MPGKVNLMLEKVISGIRGDVKVLSRHKRIPPRIERVSPTPKREHLSHAQAISARHGKALTLALVLAPLCT